MRQAYRELVFTTKGLSGSISAILISEEAFQKVYIGLKSKVRKNVEDFQSNLANKTFKTKQKDYFIFWQKLQYLTENN